MSDDRVVAPNTDAIKAGWKTSEFWVTVLGVAVSFLGQMQGTIPEPWGTVCATALGAAYTIARALAKMGAPK
jgi:hypothetical protein